MRLPSMPNRMKPLTCQYWGSVSVIRWRSATCSSRDQLIGPAPEDLRESLIGFGKLLLSAREADRYPAHRTEPFRKSLFARPSPQQGASRQRLGSPTTVARNEIPDQSIPPNSHRRHCCKHTRFNRTRKSRCDMPRFLSRELTVPLPCENEKDDRNSLSHRDFFFTAEKRVNGVRWHPAHGVGFGVIFWAWAHGAACGFRRA